MALKKHKLFSSLTYLNITQFMGALNDNVYKLLIAFLLIGIQGVEQTTSIMALSGAIYVLPFLLFSVPSGILADHYSKRTITVATKCLEVLIMIGGVIAFGLKNAWGAYTVLFLMAAQSAVFGPAKYGIVPEIVPQDKIARANGLLTAFTMLAAIIGYFMASFLTEVTHHNFVLSSISCVLISLFGFAASLCIEKTPAAGSTQKFKVFFFADIYRILKTTRSENYLMNAMFGSAFFYLVASFAMLNTIPFCMQCLGKSDVVGGYLFLVCSFGVVCGAPLAGRICNKFVEIGLSPLAGVGLALSLFLLGICTQSIYITMALLFLLGAFGGLFVVPFDSFIQVASPTKERGQNLSVTNFLAFFGILISSCLLALFESVFGMTPGEGFVVMGIVTAVVTLFFGLRLRDALVRLLSRCLSVTLQGQEIIAPTPPGIFILAQDNWKKGLLVMTATQQRYMRFLVERPSHTAPFFAWLSKARFYDNLSNEQQLIDHWLLRGYHVCILTHTAPPQALFSGSTVPCYIAEMHHAERATTITFTVTTLKAVQWEHR